MQAAPAPGRGRGSSVVVAGSPLCGHGLLPAHLQSHDAVVRDHENFVAPVHRLRGVLRGIRGGVSVRLQGLASVRDRRRLAVLAVRRLPVLLLLLVLLLVLLLLLLLVPVVLEHRRRGAHRRRRRVREQALQVVALDDLGHRARLDVPDLDERGLKRKDIGKLQGWQGAVST